eukprot:GHRQ01026100.1.p1 GENE.GHRQ01026100.1~~GHRQ01026100.1.p1  ORF type:complete len:173 (-),score=50.95 GHRQ01026100.1:101-619(-)
MASTLLAALQEDCGFAALRSSAALSMQQQRGEQSVTFARRSRTAAERLQSSSMMASSGLPALCCFPVYPAAARCCLLKQEEVDRVLGSSATPSMAQYAELKYVMRCVNESMRLYPHPPVLLRRARVADVLPGGYEVVKGQDVVISVYNIHHSPQVGGHHLHGGCVGICVAIA